MGPGRGDYEPSRSILPARVHCIHSCLWNQPYFYDKMYMLGFIILFILLINVVQPKKSTPPGVVHIMEV